MIWAKKIPAKKIRQKNPANFHKRSITIIKNEKDKKEREKQRIHEELMERKRKREIEIQKEEQKEEQKDFDRREEIDRMEKEKDRLHRFNLYIGKGSGRIVGGIIKSAS